MTKCREICTYCDIEVNIHAFYVSESGKDLFLDGIYLCSHNKLVLTNGVTLGMRSDYNGILLFDTILQPVIQKLYDVVEIELPLFEVNTGFCLTMKKKQQILINCFFCRLYSFIKL